MLDPQSKKQSKQAASVRRWITQQLAWEESLESLRESDDASNKDRSAEVVSPTRAA